jgi:L-rhamnose mutarotase
MTGDRDRTRGPLRIGRVIGLHAAHVETYRRLHADCWPAIRDRLRRAGLGNYSIFLREPENLLFSYFEYHGDDLDGDLRRMAEDPVTQEWWSLCAPCQRPLETRAPGEHWAPMDIVFHND